MEMKKCPKCGFERISKGEIATADQPRFVVFRPDCASMMSWGGNNHVKAFTCLKCGYLETFIDEEKLYDLRELESKSQK